MREACLYPHSQHGEFRDPLLRPERSVRENRNRRSKESPACATACDLPCRLVTSVRIALRRISEHSLRQLFRNCRIRPRPRPHFLQLQGIKHLPAPSVGCVPVAGKAENGARTSGRACACLALPLRRPGRGRAPPCPRAHSPASGPVAPAMASPHHREAGPCPVGPGLPVPQRGGPGGPRPRGHQQVARGLHRQPLPRRRRSRRCFSRSARIGAG